MTLFIFTNIFTDSSKKESHPATPWIIVTVLLGVVLVVGALRRFGKDYWDRGKENNKHYISCRILCSFF